MKYFSKSGRRLAAPFLLATGLAIVAGTGLAAEPAPAAPAQTFGNDAFSQLGATPSPAPGAGAVRPSALSVRWELDPESKQGVWNVRPHQQFYILPVKHSSNPNESPQSPSHPQTQTVPLKSTEAEFQLSFKAKGAENILSSNVDLWFAYTQQSQWQVYNSEISRPFRETDYQPEIFAVIPTDYDLLGLRGRFINVGFVHQSNGRAEPLSRSWNRVYAQFGFERGDFALLARPWYRLNEKAKDDDNPDIKRYMGYGDLVGIYKWGRQEFSLLSRYNPDTGNGALQGGWSFPVHARLKGYVKVFTGYGETLIDYNSKATSIGVGVMLADWL